MPQDTLRTLTLFYNYRSPFCALIVDQLFELPARYRIDVAWRLVEETPRPSSLPITTDNPRFLYNRQDCARRARWLRLPWAPAEERLGDVRAATKLGQHLLATNSPSFAPFSIAVTRAYWCYGRNATKPTVVAEIAREVGATEREIATGLSGTPSILDTLKVNADHCRTHGILGVPFFTIGEENFWGSDRLFDVEMYLAELGLGPTPDYPYPARRIANTATGIDIP
jgi:2-hydroxychromene-2-carboxylate isomerase